MNKTSIERAALLGSASALGLNWIYDRALLKKHNQEGNAMIFQSIDHELYKQAKNSYDVYPNHRLGDLDFMGEVLYLFYMFMEYEKDLDLARWRTVLYEYFREDFEYDGYIESYGKAFLEQYKDEQSGKIPVKLHTDHIDKQLSGLLFILGVYDQPRSTDKIGDALKYAQTLTAYHNVNPLTVMLYNLFTKLDQGVPKMDAMQSVLVDAPTEYQESLKQALTEIDIEPFIKDYSGVACGINQSLPLIFYIIAHTNSWKEALVLNATLGGASSARGIFISAIISRYEEIPTEYLYHLNYHVK